MTDAQLAAEIQRLHRIIEQLELRVHTVENRLLVMSTAISLARWFGPFAVSLAAIVIIVIKG